MNPYQVTRDFEQALCEYTGAQYATAVNSGTMALFLTLKWFRKEYDADETLTVPIKTYVSVPCVVIQSGFRIRWSYEPWRGEYQLKPLPVWDSARRFTSQMHRPGQYQCVSFAANKILGCEQGGAILHDNAAADHWFRKMRFDGRSEGLSQCEDTILEIGHHCIMLPSAAAALNLKLFHLPIHNEDMPDYDYGDLSLAPAFWDYVDK